MVFSRQIERTLATSSRIIFHQYISVSAAQFENRLSRIHSIRTFASGNDDKNIPSTRSLANFDQSSLQQAFEKEKENTDESKMKASESQEAEQSITTDTIKEQRKVLFPRAEEEDGVDRDVEDPAEDSNPDEDKGEYGFKYKGVEPTVYGDWAHKGRCTDF